MSNKSVGTAFENEFAEMMSKHGFWVHLFQQNAHGQPCDVIAARNGKAYLIDCKDCEKDYFDISRIETNQELAMGVYQNFGNPEGFFAIRISTGIYVIRINHLKNLRQEKKRLSGEVIRKEALTFDKWVKLL